MYCQLVAKIDSNQLPVSVIRWQNGSQIYFATFNQLKITKWQITQQQLKLLKNKYRFGTLRIRYIFDINDSLNLKTIKFYIINLPMSSSDKQAI
jgi:hypothetical protein